MSKNAFNFILRKSRIALYREDCIKGMRTRLSPGSVDVVVTSPPYNLGVTYNHYNDKISRQEYLDWMRDWARSVSEVLSEGGSLFLNIGGKPSDPWGPFDVLGVMRDYFYLQNVIHWIKSVAIQKKDVGNYPGISGDVAVGHYKPINGERYLNDCHEYIFHLTKSGEVKLDRLAVGVPYQDKSNIGRWRKASRGIRCRGNTWFVPYKTIRSRDKQRPHPATFPVQIPKMCLMLHGLDKIRLSLDPFLGIGHSALAALELGVDFAGFEIDQVYFETACEIIEQAETPDNI